MPPSPLPPPLSFFYCVFSPSPFIPLITPSPHVPCSSVPGSLTTACVHRGTSPHQQPQFLDLQIFGDAHHGPPYCLTWATASCPSGPQASHLALNTTVDLLFFPPPSLWLLQSRESRICPLGAQTAQQSSRACTFPGRDLSHDPALTLASRPGENRPRAENSSNTSPYTTSPASHSLLARSSKAPPTHLSQANSYPTPWA